MTNDTIYESLRGLKVQEVMDFLLHHGWEEQEYEGPWVLLTFEVDGEEVRSFFPEKDTEDRDGPIVSALHIYSLVKGVDVSEAITQVYDRRGGWWTHFTESPGRERYLQRLKEARVNCRIRTTDEAYAQMKRMLSSDEDKDT